MEMENAKFETDFALFLQQNAKGVKGGLKDRKLNGLSQHLRYVSLTASPKVYFLYLICIHKLPSVLILVELTDYPSCVQY